MLRETGKRSGVCAAQVIIFFTKQLCAFSAAIVMLSRGQERERATLRGLLNFFFPFLFLL